MQYCINRQYDTTVNLKIEIDPSISEMGRNTVLWRLIEFPSSVCSARSTRLRKVLPFAPRDAN